MDTVRRDALTIADVAPVPGAGATSSLTSVATTEHDVANSLRPIQWQPVAPIKLSDYKGSWVVLFSHPADFTPVCTTEFIGFAKNAPAFEQMGVKLIGLSIDSIYSHIAWVKNIEKNFGVEIPFPVIADLDMNVAQKYGMIHPGAATTATVRCVFVINPKQNVRAMIYYPLSNWRSIDEVKRLVTALQTTDQHGRATPEGWCPGDKVIVPPPTTIKDTNEREKAGYEMKDWYFSKTDLK